MTSRISPLRIGTRWRGRSVSFPRLSVCAAVERLRDGAVWLVRAIHHFVARRAVVGRDAALCEDEFVWGTCVRLGMGGCLSTARTALLPEAGVCGTVYAGEWEAIVGED